MISAPQIRGARAMLGWTASDLAERAGTTRNTIQRLEQQDGVPATRAQTLRDIQSAFELAGIEFIGTPDEPGLILRPPKQDEL